MALREKDPNAPQGSNAHVFNNMGKAKVRNPYADAAALLVDKLVSPEMTEEADKKTYESGVDSGGPVNAATKYSVHAGLSTRDHYAGLAMQSLLLRLQDISDPDKVAITAFRMADAMIREMRFTRKNARGRSNGEPAPPVTNAGGTTMGGATWQQP
jgi:hypothetical protein